MDNKELVKKVFIAQKLSPCKDDWIHQLREDLKECDINLSENEIKDMKKHTFRKLVNERMYQSSICYH